MSVDFRIIENMLFNDAVFVSATSQDSSFPASNGVNPSRAKVWRSSTLGYYEIDSNNNKLDFDEGGGELTAIINPGNYNSTTLASEITSQMNVVGANTYTVSKVTGSSKWRIVSSGGVSLLTNTGTNVASSIYPVIGFGVDADYSSNTIHNGAYVAIHTHERLIFDVGSTEGIDTIALFPDLRRGFNLSSEAVIKIEANYADSWASPALSETVTIDENNAMFIKFYDTDQSYPYWSVKIIDKSNPNLQVELSKLVLGKAVSLTRVPNVGFDISLIDNTRISTTPYGQLYADKYPVRKEMSFDYQFLNNTDLETIVNLYGRIGKTTPIVVEVDANEQLFLKERFSIYGTVTRAPAFKHQILDYFNTKFTVEEIG